MQDQTALKSTNSLSSNIGTEPVIDLTGLCFSYSEKASPILEIDRFQVHSGEMLFIMGPSGSGKSTLLSILTGILLPQQGEVKILGQSFSQLSGPARDRFRADNIGYIFQMFNLIPYLSVVENVILPCQFSSSRKKRTGNHSSSIRHEALRLLTHLNLQDPGLLSQPVVELSVGQQQRVAAARALIGHPKLVIADEPTSSLDTEHRESFLRLLFDECLKSGATLIFVSHDTTLASLFSRVIELKKINMAPGASGGGKT